MSSCSILSHPHRHDLNTSTLCGSCRFSLFDMHVLPCRQFARSNVVADAALLLKLANWEYHFAAFPVFNIMCIGFASTSFAVDFADLTIKRIERSQDMSSRANRYTHESSRSGNSSTSGERFCGCGLRASLKVSNSVANPGREYYSCPARRCRYFMWAGPVRTARLRGQIHE
ncbi:hypothetical protein PIB30_089223 [Stylosanthes scabra]|uniref:GRF-type domain-containing protein n=1 Tax=Stylosanthes scabra TaxID=79078 RepID=A0ABU6UWL2_9FABA|nr:hypothetical protein [Stylosanthes scabra]